MDVFDTSGRRLEPRTDSIVDTSRAMHNNLVDTYILMYVGTKEQIL